MDELVAVVALLELDFTTSPALPHTPVGIATPFVKLALALCVATTELADEI